MSALTPAQADALAGAAITPGGYLPPDTSPRVLTALIAAGYIAVSITPDGRAAIDHHHRLEAQRYEDRRRARRLREVQAGFRAARGGDR